MNNNHVISWRAFKLQNRFQIHIPLSTLLGQGNGQLPRKFAIAIIEFQRTEIFVGSRFHWLTCNLHIITFNSETELSGVVKLPGLVMGDGGWRGICLGSSEGYFHYAFVNGSEVQVWMLKDYCELMWVLKHVKQLLITILEHRIE